MTPALHGSARFPEVRSEGGSFPLAAFRFLTCKIFNSKFKIRISNSGLIPEPLNPLIPCRRPAAFSLVELLAVVGIIAILSVAAVPVMRGLGGAQSSRATAQTLVSALEQARTAAILSGTNAYLALPDATFPATNYRFCSYVMLRPTVDQDANNRDDFQTNVTAPGWVTLSKWERLPGDLIFSAARLAPPPAGITNLSVSRLAVPGTTNWSGTLPVIGFTPTGGLADPSGTNGLLFASSNKVSAGRASVADRVDISFYSGRVRYAGVVTNTNF